MLSAAPTGRVIEKGYRPEITDTGQRHPVTEGLERFAPPAAEGEDGPGRGRWFRLIDPEVKSGSTVMTGLDERPLPVPDRAGEGRIAMLGSDQIWLWSRGFGCLLQFRPRMVSWCCRDATVLSGCLSIPGKKSRRQTTG